jgi:23S rRNA (guanine2445-N2)-methyltransferase / 23S rRNA (guanine2069-N7)-methyltransferase
VRPALYDVIFIDPPTHSRSKRMQREFDVQRDHAWLLATAGKLLAPQGTIVFSNNFQKFRLDAALERGFVVEDITRSTIPEDFARNSRIHVCFLLRARPELLAGT